MKLGKKEGKREKKKKRGGEGEGGRKGETERENPKSHYMQPLWKTTWPCLPTKAKHMPASTVVQWLHSCINTQEKCMHISTQRKVHSKVTQYSPQGRNNPHVHQWQINNGVFMQWTTAEQRKKERATVTPNNTDEPHKHNIRRRNPDTKEHVLRDSTHMKFENRQHKSDRSQNSGYLWRGQPSGEGWGECPIAPSGAGCSGTDLRSMWASCPLKISVCHTRCLLYLNKCFIIQSYYLERRYI